jgi:transposase
LGEGKGWPSQVPKRYQVSLGKRPQELEDIYETSFKSICNWVHRLNQGGIEALVDKVKPGRTIRLSQDRFSDIKTILVKKKPEQFGYNTSTWTGPLLIDYIKQHYGIEYKKRRFIILYIVAP